MLSQTKISSLEVGQRVKVVVFEGSGKSVDSYPVHYRKYTGQIGYITDLKDMPTENGKQGENQTCHYEVFITKLGITLEFPEECLELSEHRGFVL
jgi:hypothetical protein